VRSQALVIILALIVVASGLVLAFLSLVQVDRQATASYSQSVRAEQIGQGSLQLIVGQLQQEMNKDNPPDTGGGLYPAIYTNVTSANIRPQPIGTNSAMPVLVKISAATNFYTGTNGGAAALFPNGSLMASSISSTAGSVNGRYVSVARWSQAYMGTFPNNASAPNWVMLSRSGPVTNTTMGVSVANSLNNPSPANTNYVVGRFAYAIYDEGSLLDITVAGHPSALTAAQSAQIKGSLAGADLTPLGINPDQLIAWRNATTGASTNTYINYVTNYASTNGFQAVYPGDSTFLSRQDLISAAQNGIAGLSTSVLTNLATFTREANSPSWSPSYNATDLGGNNGTGNVYAYKNNALTSGSTNRFIIGVRAGTANSAYQAYHDDGTTYADPISAGDSLVRRRFSLARLNWLGPNGAQNGGTTANIQACFGLKWATAVDSNLNTAGASLWQYVGPTGSTELGSIETLDQVAAETTKREPNFFELLQAGILSGSLAVDGGGTTANIIPNIHLKSATLQILRIGASIIDQYDADSDPTLIEYSQSGIPWIASGSENLPYLNTVETVGGVSPDNASALAVYLLFGLWNPNRQPATALTLPSLRLRVQGNFSIHTQYATSTAPNSPNPDGSGNPGYLVTIPNTISLALASTSSNGAYGFLDPQLPVAADASTAPPASGPGNASSATGTWVITPPLGVNSKNYVGYRMPDLQLDTTTTHATQSPAATAKYSFLTASAGSASTFAAILEYLSPAGTWLPYSYSTGINDSPDTSIQSSSQQTVALFSVGPAGGPYKITTISALAGTANSIGPALGILPLYLTSDPRSLRFGEWQFDRIDDLPAPTTAGEDARLWRASMPTASGVNTYGAFQASGYGGDPSLTTGTPGSNISDVQVQPLAFGTTFYYPARLARNNSANTVPDSSYVDRDGVLRMGDSGMYPSTQDNTAGNPFAGNSVRPQDRPVILNRPFQSVAELGYVLRDDPWRSLDFFSANSADAALLDLFSVNEFPTGVVAGRINLNSQNSVALQAILNSTITDTVAGTTVSNPAAVAQALATFTLTTPLVNKADLVNKFVGSTTALPSTDFGSTDEQNIKAQREAAVRSLVGVGQTRTWNLMIDLVAQAGRYPPTAQTLDQFVVEGERRYWLHLAIDRFTGKVIAQKLEPVTD
jgi:hypothetical protein